MGSLSFTASNSMYVESPPFSWISTRLTRASGWTRITMRSMALATVSAARSMGYPARYVSGYLMMNDRVMQDASHAWAEAHIQGLGWVGFDVSNGISPDSRYVRVATALDYRGAAPISGMRFGQGTESMDVSLQVQQQ